MSKVCAAARLGVLAIAVLSVVGALWPLWILLLVTSFVFIVRVHRVAPWAGPHRPLARQPLAR